MKYPEGEIIITDLRPEGKSITVPIVNGKFSVTLLSDDVSFRGEFERWENKGE